jgi:hypothetical protein
MGFFARVCDFRKAARERKLIAVCIGYAFAVLIAWVAVEREKTAVGKAARRPSGNGKPDSDYSSKYDN